MPFPPTSPALMRALADRNYTDPTPVQTAVSAPDAATRDLLVSAQTGSGKTVAYGLALAATLLGDAERMERAQQPLALIVAPTRELALQVHLELTWLFEHAGARIVACVGGMDPQRERRRLADGAHIVVGTPGRLRDHLERGALKVTQLKAVVLDEADEMLDLGFREDLEFILQATPAERRTLLFSATLPHAITSLAKRFQRDALRLDVSAGVRGHADIEYRAIRIAPNDVEHAVVNVLRFVDSPGAIVFCNTREAVRHLQAILSERGFSAVSLSGELSQGERNQALQALRDGRARVCVATDVAARGIDLPNLGLIIHADLPHDAEVLQHRSGRTGRAGRKGVSVVLVPVSRRRRAEQMLSAAGIRATWSGPPTPDEIRKLDQERLLKDPLLAEEQSEDELAMARLLLEQRSAEEIASALVRLYRSRLPAPEDVADPGNSRPAREYGDRTGGDRRERTPRAWEKRDKPGHDAPAGERGGFHHKRHAPREGEGGPTVWFRLDIGRNKNADPKWLLPMICRRGKVVKQDIGAIRIFEEETRFEIMQQAAEAFAAAVGGPGHRDGRIERVAANTPPEPDAPRRGPSTGPVPGRGPGRDSGRDHSAGAGPARERRPGPGTGKPHRPHKSKPYAKKPRAE